MAQNDLLSHICLSQYREQKCLVCSAHRDILLEATSSQKVRETKVSSGDQGGEPTLSH